MTPLKTSEQQIKNSDGVAPETTQDDESRDRLAPLSLTALGIVFGDIGTSPLYAFRQSIHGGDPILITEINVLGVLSLIFWALIIVISIKYMIFMLRADNEGEGGILALVALLRPWKDTSFRSRKILIALGLFGAALLYGDGIITPAISVLSAIEGIGLATPALKPFVIPFTITVLVLLFLFQKNGTARVGMIFGPVMLLWFITLAALGLASILRRPEVLVAVNPAFAVDFLLGNGWIGFLILGAVFLVVTGGEALYADMGHFGRFPIRLAWFSLVLPALLLNYFGQGALVLKNPNIAAEPFYHLAPSWAIYPLIVLATVSTVIASQAVISGAFSLTRQAVQLGLCPRLTIIQTSPDMIGQVYVPAVNWLLMISTMALVLGFGSSAKLAGAYGVAITSTMVITTVLAFFVMRGRWGWNPVIAGITAASFLMVDLLFLSANLTKITQGGWIPLLVAGIVYILLSTWRLGRAILEYRLRETKMSLDAFLDRLYEEPPLRVSGTAVFMTGRTEGTPPMLLHHLEHNQVLHEQLVLLTVVTKDVPRVPAAERLEISSFRLGFFRVFINYGFMQSPNIPVAMRECERLGLKIDLQTVTYYLGRETLIPSSTAVMKVWRKVLFAIMSRNAARATAFYSIPPERVVEIGIQVEL
jgi:KUP system potassium uptake protein